MNLPPTRIGIPIRIKGIGPIIEVMGIGISYLLFLRPKVYLFGGN